MPGETIREKPKCLDRPERSGLAAPLGSSCNGDPILGAVVWIEAGRCTSNGVEHPAARKPLLGLIPCSVNGVPGIGERRIGHAVRLGRFAYLLLMHGRHVTGVGPTRKAPDPM